MLSEKNNENLNVENEQMNNSMREIDNNNNLNPRGFNIFLAHGISTNELRILRTLYHLSYLHNNIANNRNIDMSPQAMFQREEDWLRAQMNHSNIRRNNYYNNYYRRNIVVRNPRNNSVVLYVDHNLSGIRPRRIHRHANYEPNILFLQGFIFGLVLNVFSLCIIIISRPRPKFKIGLMLGMLLSMCLTFPFMAESKR